MSARNPNTATVGHAGERPQLDLAKIFSSPVN